MAESRTVPPSKKYRYKPNKKVGYIKMEILEDISKETTNEQVERTIDEGSSATTDGGNNYNDLKESLTGHEAFIAKVKGEASKILPWVGPYSNLERQEAPAGRAPFHGQGIPAKLSRRILLQIQPAVLRFGVRQAGNSLCFNKMGKECVNYPIVIKKMPFDHSFVREELGDTGGLSKV